MKKEKSRAENKKTKNTPNAIPYTHQDGSGMPWRFVGSRPVSALADQVMRDCGFEPLNH
jgi:hypothetical protein